MESGWKGSREEGNMRNKLREEEEKWFNVKS